MSGSRTSSRHGRNSGTKQRCAEGRAARFAGDVSYWTGDSNSQPMTAQEQLLALHTVKASRDPSVDCSICLSTLAEKSPYTGGLRGSVSLKLCGHQFHASCLHQLAGHDTSCLTCPNCHTIHGVRTGTQPVGGQMEVVKILDSLPGHEGYRTIRISYSFPRGVQGPEHPSPGRPYNLHGFPRVAYLPDSDKGRLVWKLLQEAFDRRLVFTVGTSSTSGTPDCVVWNGIHHKTEITNEGGHGYPDPNFLENVIKELAGLGVTEESLRHSGRQ